VVAGIVGGTPTGKEQAVNDKTRRYEVVEEIEVSGKELVERVRGLIEDGNASRVTIRSQKGEELMTVPVSFGVVAGGLIAFTMPLLAAVGALAALVTKVKLEIVRKVDEPVAEEPEREPVPSS
jgi:hypothetical protein